MDQRKLVWLIPIIVVTVVIVYMYPFGDTEVQEEPVQIDLLFKSNWVLQSLMIDSHEITFSEPRKVTILFDENGEVGGSGGCNTFFGEYQISGEYQMKSPGIEGEGIIGAGGSLSFGVIATTEMACIESEDIIEQEAQFYSALNKVSSFQLIFSSLILSSQDEQTILRLRLA